MHLWIDGSDRPARITKRRCAYRTSSGANRNARGLFGPWSNEDPGTSPLAGTYTFQNADLGVFRGNKAGTLQSAGSFSTASYRGSKLME